MAEKLEISEVDLFCPICVEVFREPVSLSCQHSFCQECLKCIVQKDTEKTCGDIEFSDESNHVITCPVCRSFTNLGIKGVEGLPVQSTLANRAKKLRGQKTVDDAIPGCSACEDEGNKPAVNFCATCSLFYCQECVQVMHPMRGGLKRHNLMTVDEYLSQQQTTRATNDVIKISDQCPDHGQQVVVFCGSCQGLLCKQCISDHDGHTLNDIRTVYHKNLTMLEEKTTALEQLNVQVEGMLAELAKFQAELEEKKSLQMVQTEKAFTEAIEAINAWRRDTLKSIGKRYRAWLLHCTQATGGLKFQTEQIKSLIQSAKRQLSTPKISAVEEHCKLETRINDLSELVEGNLQHQEVLNTKWLEEMNLDSVIPRKLEIEEIQISTPKLLFENSSHQGVQIRESGHVLVALGGLSSYSRNVEYNSAGVQTDGKWKTGRHYWELDITLNVEAKYKAGLIYSSGVRVNSSGTSYYLGDCSSSWGVCVVYRNDQFTFVCRYKEEDQSTSLPVYPKDFPKTGTVRLGFYLNCEKQTLTAIDCTYNRVLHTFTDLNISENLTPASSVGDYKEMNVSVRVRQGNLSTLFKVLPNAFQC